MFTGIIHGQGTVLALHPQGQETRLHIRALYALNHICQGESIAINGVCLTVESFDMQEFSAYASAETLRRTNLGQLCPHSTVNMERALAVGDRLGGHMVSGHVDCLAKVAHITTIGQSRCIRVIFAADYSPEVVAKGSITLDGISLTVNACGQEGQHGWLEVNVIPETWRVTTVGQWCAGIQVNMETDIIGKYVRHMLMPWQKQDNTNITENFLHQHGFI